MSSYIQIRWDVITHPRPNFLGNHGGFAKQQLSQTLMSNYSSWLLICRCSVLNLHNTVVKHHTVFIILVNLRSINITSSHRGQMTHICVRKLDQFNDEVIKWKHFPRNWPFVRGIHKSQWRWALMFSLIYVWINDWVNNREARDLRRYPTHYDVIVMFDLVHIMALCLFDA